MKTETPSQGMGFWSLLQLVFIVLKLCQVINWSWWWVLSPLWISSILLVVFLALIKLCSYMER
jgi:hypothetical protein